MGRDISLGALLERHRRGALELLREAGGPALVDRIDAGAQFALAVDRQFARLGEADQRKRAEAEITGATVALVAKHPVF